MKETAHYTGVIINSVDRDKNWYLRRVLKLKIEPPELIKKIFEWNEAWHPVRFGIEKEKYTLVIMPFLKAEMKKKDIQLPIEELVHKDASKEMRIKGLIPRYEAGMVYHNADDPGHHDLEDELQRFPKAATDDLSDAEASQLEIAKEPDKPEAPPDYTQKGGVKKYYPNLGV